jgi:hypothetical protein
MADFSHGLPQELPGILGAICRKHCACFAGSLRETGSSTSSKLELVHRLLSSDLDFVSRCLPQPTAQYRSEPPKKQLNFSVIIHNRKTVLYHQQAFSLH